MGRGEQLGSEISFTQLFLLPAQPTVLLARTSLVAKPTLAARDSWNADVLGTRRKGKDDLCMAWGTNL
jgi:hypothetical protein